MPFRYHQHPGHRRLRDLRDHQAVLKQGVEVIRAGVLSQGPGAGQHREHYQPLLRFEPQDQGGLQAVSFAHEDRAHLQHSGVFWVLYLLQHGLGKRDPLP